MSPKQRSKESEVKPTGADSNDKAGEQEEEEDDSHLFGKDLPLEQRVLGRSLWMCRARNKFRWCIARTVNHKAFTIFIILMILGSSIILAIENPLDDPEGQKTHILFILDAIMTGIFCLEAIMKIIAYGFVLGHKHTYLRNCWNVMDFIIVVFSVVSLAVSNS